MPTVSPWVRVTHLPSGLQADCHRRGNPADVRGSALRLLRGRLWLRRHGVCEPAEWPVIRDYAAAPEPSTYQTRKEDVTALARDLDADLRTRPGMR